MNTTRPSNASKIDEHKNPLFNHPRGYRYQRRHDSEVHPREQIGVKTSSLLESAIHRPLSSAFGEDAYRTIWNKAAALFESLGQNHPFQNDNKRTAFTALLIFLRYNGYHFKMDPKAAEDFTVDMVNHKYAFEELTSII